jgi:hypothetical protein
MLAKLLSVAVLEGILALWDARALWCIELPRELNTTTQLDIVEINSACCQIVSILSDKLDQGIHT